MKFDTFWWGWDSGDVRNLLDRETIGDQSWSSCFIKRVVHLLRHHQRDPRSGDVWWRMGLPRNGDVTSGFFKVYFLAHFASKNWACKPTKIIFCLENVRSHANRKRKNITFFTNTLINSIFHYKCYCFLVAKMVTMCYVIHFPENCNHLFLSLK